MADTLTSNVIPFTDEDEMREKLKSYDISIYDTRRNYKQFYYKGINTKGKPVICTPYGIEKHGNYETLIIKVDDELYPINFDYFKEMQSNSFSLAKKDEEWYNEIYGNVHRYRWQIL